MTDSPVSPDSPESSAAPDAFPTAAVRGGGAGAGGSRWLTRYWLLTVLAAVVSIVLVAAATGGGGPTIRIRFDDGRGLAPGNALRHRGIEVGHVVAVDLAADGGSVEVQVELEPVAAATVARAGSRFWIARPQVSLARVSGLDTVVGAKWVGVEPGPEGAEASAEFVGLEQPPTLETISEPARTEIRIRFDEGHGIAPGDRLEHRGIVVGEVIAVDLAPDLGSVLVRVRLVDSARSLARVGTQFWVERPQIGLAGIRGIDTLVGGRYLACLPGPLGAAPLDAFTGRSEPPALAERAEGGLEVVLEGVERFGVDRGSAVTYRGIPIGKITSVGLSTDAAKVEARAWIEPAFRQLIRGNTHFFSVSGVEVSMGWTGIDLDLESVASLAAGGVAVATPDQRSPVVATGHRFVLHETGRPEWLAWRPRIPIGTALLPEGLPPPEPLRVTLRWSEDALVGSNARQRDGWGIVLAGGRLLAPRDLVGTVDADDDVVDGTVVIAAGGVELRPAADRIHPIGGRLAVVATGVVDLGAAVPWPAARLRERPAAPEDVLVITDPRGAILPVTAARITVDAVDGTWAIDPALAIGVDGHGAGVVSRRDGALVGVLVTDGERVRIVPLTRTDLAGD